MGHNVLIIYRWRLFKGCGDGPVSNQHQMKTPVRMSAGCRLL